MARYRSGLTTAGCNMHHECPPEVSAKDPAPNWQIAAAVRFDVCVNWPLVQPFPLTHWRDQHFPRWISTRQLDYILKDLIQTGISEVPSLTQPRMLRMESPTGGQTLPSPY
ncbi:hypothetical protein Bbelb_431200 [Branchiostoma belcheri]|nr:hypothetical protein Bbelb_431200 [Branchiostoma belcheri]